MDDLLIRGALMIDARGRVVAPGSIDIHTHSDFLLPLNPRAESKIRQGVTTEVVGNCGFSVAPARPGKVEMLAEYLAASCGSSGSATMTSWPTRRGRHHQGQAHFRTQVLFQEVQKALVPRATR